MIFEPQDIHERVLDCDVCLVGSGASGGAAAWYLARSGLNVVCLEAGGHYTESDFSRDFGVASRQLYAEDGQRIMSGNLFIPVAGGECIGGSTVINSGICFRIPEERFEQWRRDWGLDFSFQDLVPHIETVEQMIGVGPSNPAIFGGNNAFCMKGLEELGWAGGPMPRNAPGCVGCGSCNIGCPTGAKLSVAKTFIPASEEFGANFYTWARAEEALMDGNKVVGVRARLGNPKLDEDHGWLEVRAKAVVLCAGAIQTPVFLQRNQLGNGHVGQHLRVHPATGVIATTNQEVNGWNGVPQGFYCDEFLADDAMILESYWASPEVFYMAFPFGHEGTGKMAEFGQMAALGGTIADEGEGSVKQLGGGGKVRVSYDLVDADRRRLIRMLQRICQLLFAAGAREIQPGVHGLPALKTMDEARRWLDEDRIRAKQLMSLYSSHPQATARMGERPEDSVVDCSGAIYGHEGLYVMDASVFPDVLGVNPQVTVMSLALLLSDRLANRMA
ncbi:MAG TPA: hypothetical protein DIU15_07675 [Deltaproteobacteria bacterium]|nr:hypothetical protein [Deltaproteobacteria bacterium]HCP45904.1 hypothetical protein [Deltaproteobacteria bacterium]